MATCWKATRSAMPCGRPVAEWSEADRERMADAAHDIANMVAAGHTPRADDVNTFRRLQQKRDAWLKATEVSSRG